MTAGLTEAETLVSPGADEPRLSLRAVLRPRWRSVAGWLSLGLIAALILVVVLPRPHPGVVKAVDLSKAIAQARALGAFPVLLPSPLPAGWIPDSVHLDAGLGREHLHIGYRTPDFGYAGLEETSATRWHAIVSQVTGGGAELGAITINDRSWVQLESTRRQLPSLLWYGPNCEVIVAGTTTMAALEEFVQILQIS